MRAFVKPRAFCIMISSSIDAHGHSQRFFTANNHYQSHPKKGISHHEMGREA
jgi:hypothetical protein